MDKIIRPKRITIEVTEEMQARFSSACKLAGVTRVKVLREAVEAFCKEVENEN